MSSLSSFCSMNRQIFQLVPKGSAFTSRHSGWSPRGGRLTCNGWLALTGVRTTLSPITTCVGVRGVFVRGVSHEVICSATNLLRYCTFCRLCMCSLSNPQIFIACSMRNQGSSLRFSYKSLRDKPGNEAMRVFTVYLHV